MKDFKKMECPILLFMVRFIILLVHCCKMEGMDLNLLNYTFMTQKMKQASETSDVSMLIHSDHTRNLYIYEAPTSSGVTVLMIGPSNWDILLSQLYRKYLSCTPLMTLCIMCYYFQEVMM